MTGLLFPLSGNYSMLHIMEQVFFLFINKEILPLPSTPPASCFFWAHYTAWMWVWRKLPQQPPLPLWILRCWSGWSNCPSVHPSRHNLQQRRNMEVGEGRETLAFQPLPLTVKALQSWNLDNVAAWGGNVRGMDGAGWGRPVFTFWRKCRRRWDADDCCCYLGGFAVRSQPVIWFHI